MELPLAGLHHGVLLEYDDGSRIVFELTPDRGWRWGGLDEFARGMPCRLYRPESDPDRIDAILDRLDRLHCWPNHSRFDLLRCNCEHRANWVLSNRHESAQIKELLTAGLLSLSMCALLVASGVGGR